MTIAPRVAGELRQTQTLAPRMMQSLRLLAKSLPELRAEIAEEMSRNPAIEDVDHPLETSLSEVERRSDESSPEPDYPEDDFEPGRNVDEDAAERRQSFFDNQVKTETLQEHLLSQLPLSDIPRDDWQEPRHSWQQRQQHGRWPEPLPEILLQGAIFMVHRRAFADSRRDAQGD